MKKADIIKECVLNQEGIPLTDFILTAIGNAYILIKRGAMEMLSSVYKVYDPYRRENVFPCTFNVKFLASEIFFKLLNKN